MKRPDGTRVADATTAAAAAGEPAADAPAPAAGAEAEPWERIISAAEPPVAAPLPALALARVDRVRDDGALVVLGGKVVLARIDPSVHRTVVEGAHARGERVLVEVGADGEAVIVGGLRTQPTPGIDAADEYTIAARRISIEAGEQVAISARAATVVLRALGEVETYAERILSRAEGVHKIVGRMLRLN